MRASLLTRCHSQTAFARFDALPPVSGRRTDHDDAHRLRRTPDRGHHDVASPCHDAGSIQKGLGHFCWRRRDPASQGRGPAGAGAANDRGIARPDPDAELVDTVGVRSRIAEGGYAGVVVLHLTSVAMRARGETIPTIGNPSETLAEYLRRSPRSALAPGQETVITMEARLYSVRDGKLIWAGTSDSFSPLSIGELIDQVVDASIQELRDQRLL